MARRDEVRVERANLRFRMSWSQALTPEHFFELRVVLIDEASIARLLDMQPVLARLPNAVSAKSVEAAVHVVFRTERHPHRPKGGRDEPACPHHGFVKIQMRELGVVDADLA